MILFVIATLGLLNHGAVTPGPTETENPTNNKQNSVNNDDSVQ